jgi:phage terminase large subunit-like protein
VTEVDDSPELEALFQVFDRIAPEVLDQQISQMSRELIRRETENKLATYHPYPKQADFHAAGKKYRERLLSAANQVGKTLSAGAEVAMHLTQRYPDWWEGKTFDKPGPWWVAGITAESTRDNPQRILMGRVGQWGTGMIPKDAIVGDPSRNRSVADGIDMVKIKHGGGGDVQAGESTVQFKAYNQGRAKFQGETLQGAWCDEEMDDPEIYTEILTRTNVGMGPVLMTFTPLMGVTEVVRRFIIDKIPGTYVVNMTIDDAEHFSPEDRAAIISTYKPHEMEARTKGIPSRGSGAVFPIALESILCDSFPIPDHWAQVCGIDFGWDHPSAGVKLAFNRDTDELYVTAAYREREQTPVLFSAAVKPWGDWIPWAWPHDGKQSGGKFDLKDQVQLATLYRQHGLKMHLTHATFENGDNGVEAGITEMLERMQTGRLLVFRELHEWQEEFELYHRKDGIIVKEHDDLLAATRYAMMMRRIAKTKAEANPKKRVEPRGESIFNRGQEHSWMG